MFGGRCLVLNASGELLQVTDSWIEAVLLVHKGKATVLGTYDTGARAERVVMPVPCVVMLKKWVHTGKRKQTFAWPSKRNIAVRDGFKCAYCRIPISVKSVSRDHVLPKSRGGKDTMANVVASCKKCNNRKDAKLPHEAGMVLHVVPGPMTEAQKMEALVKTHRAFEREAWMKALNENGLELR
jgi:5-methylcytosine-specific restriction endonuclease McrA